MSKQIIESNEFKWGNNGEKAVSKILQDNTDWIILPLHQFDEFDKSPYVIVNGEKIPLPDIQVIKKGRVAYIECKLKHQFVHFTNDTETGFDKKSYDYYKTLAEATGCRITIFFIHLGEDEGLYQIDINEPINRIWDGKAPNGKKIEDPIVFWKKEQLTINKYSKDLLSLLENS